MPEGAVYVGRPTRWGNPFPVHFESLDAYRALLNRDFAWFRRSGFCKWTAGAIFSWTLTCKEDVQKLLEPLRGKDLVCWCRIGAPCHADVLLELANEQR